MPPAEEAAEGARRATGEDRLLRTNELVEKRVQAWGLQNGVKMCGDSAFNSIYLSSAACLGVGHAIPRFLQITATHKPME